MTNEYEAISPISGKRSELLFQQQVLGKHLASYYFDKEVGYIFVGSPHWLEEAYSNAISVTDTGIFARNLRNAEVCKKIFKDHIAVEKFRGVDLGAGYGVFVRAMRDVGLNFFWHDLYADNLFARGFEATKGSYDAAVAFEVLEHTTNPLQFLLDQKSHFGFSRLVFSATCFEEGSIPDKNWWYWSFETGQHISFFTERSLQYLAKCLEMRVSHLVGDIYIFEDLALSNSLSVGGKTALQRLANFLLRVDRRLSRNAVGSLTWSDHLFMRDKLRNKSDGG